MKNKTVEVDRRGLQLLIAGGWGCAAVAVAAIVTLNKIIKEKN